MERALSSGLDAARDAVQAKMIELLQTYKKELGGGNLGGGGLQFPANLRALPMLFLGLIKNVSPSVCIACVIFIPTDIIPSSASANRLRFLVIFDPPLFACFRRFRFLC